MIHPDNLENFEYKAIITSYTFSENIANVVKVIKDSSLLNLFLTSIFPLHTYYMNVSKFTRFFQKDSEIVLSLDKENYVRFIATKIIDSNYFTQICWKAQSNIKEIFFLCEMNFHYVSEYQTNFFGVYYIPKILENYYELNFGFEDFCRNKYYNIINNYLLSKEYLKTHTETFKTKGNFNFCLKMFSNVKITCEFIGIYIYSSTKDFIKGTKILLKIPDQKNNLTEIRINVQEVKKTKKDILLGAIILNKNHNNSYLTFQVLSGENEEILFILSNKFNKSITESELKRVSNIKLKVFQNINKVLEKHSQKKK